MGTKAYRPKGMIKFEKLQTIHALTCDVCRKAPATVQRMRERLDRLKLSRGPWAYDLVMCHDCAAFNHPRLWQKFCGREVRNRMLSNT